VKALKFTGLNDVSSAQSNIANNAVNKNGVVDQVLSTVNIDVFYFHFGLNLYL